MTTFAATLKDEIRRLARKEVKAQTGSMIQAIRTYRREIAQLKRRIQEQEKNIKELTRQSGKRLIDHELNGVDDGVRFSARSVKAQRRRTGLSAAGYAKLVGVSPLTIYNWESSKSRPRKEQLKSLVALRGLGKREAQQKLSQVQPAKGARKR